MLGSFKVTKDIIYKVAKERGKKDKFLEVCIIHNWYNSGDECEICINHQEIEDKIVKIILNLNQD